LWAGTNSGQILVFLLNIPVGGAEKRNTEKVSAMLAKEIQLKHKAPVINIQVVDNHGVPVQDVGGDNQVPQYFSFLFHRHSGKMNLGNKTISVHWF
jgi:lethal(2) giant larvae protein